MSFPARGASRAATWRVSLCANAGDVGVFLPANKGQICDNTAAGNLPARIGKRTKAVLKRGPKDEGDEVNHSRRRLKDIFPTRSGIQETAHPLT